ncbi:MAG TPA: hypothetical protein VN783_00110 [Thermoanaerobaculia bacterium]|nr:hypothetical protein [Thermoanaerobaculia bacterium]
MKILGQAPDRHGRIWEVRVLTFEESEEEDFRFWHDELTPEQRVVTTMDCLADCLKAQGIDELPRLRGISRVLQREGG